MYVLINPGEREEVVQCAHTTWNQLRSIATLELFGIPTPRTVRPGTPIAVKLTEGPPAVGTAVNVNTARRTIVIPRDAREIRLLSDTGGVIRRYYWDADARAPVEELPLLGETAEMMMIPSITTAPVVEAQVKEQGPSRIGFKATVLDSPFGSPEKDATAQTYGYRDFKDAVFCLAQLDEAGMKRLEHTGWWKSAALEISPELARLCRAGDTPECALIDGDSQAAQAAQETQSLSDGTGGIS